MELVIDATLSKEIVRQLPRSLLQESLQEPPPAEGAWWVVVRKEGVEVYAAPSWLTQAQGKVLYLSPVRCLGREGAWMHISLGEAQPLGWAMWKEAKGKHWSLALKPLGLVEVESRWVNEDGEVPVRIPGDALEWKLDEVDVFLGSAGAMKPSRMTAIGRSRKPLMRAVRFGPTPLEYRVNAKGDEGGVFALAEVKAGRLIERVPLLRITEAASRLSGVLGQLFIRLPPEGGKDRFAIPLGFGRLYDAHYGANCRFGYFGDDDIVVWATKDVFIGEELFLELNGFPLNPPRVVIKEAERTMAEELELKFDAKLPAGKLARSGGLMHGTSTAHGRGVFARQDYEPGDLLESCPAVQLDEVGAKALVSYRWGIKDKQEEEFFLPLSLGALYNHFEPPHARGKLDTARRVLEIHAELPIRKGQEVLVTYGDSYFDDDFAQLGHSRGGILPAAKEALWMASTCTNWAPKEMKWDGYKFVEDLAVGPNGWESFQILVMGKWESAIYPSIRDGNPFVDYAILGPDGKGHGRNWTVGRHPKDRVSVGDHVQVAVDVNEQGAVSKVSWTRQDGGGADRAIAASAHT